MTEKLYIDAQQYIEDAFQLGVDIICSGFRPTLMLAIWRGGVPVGIAVQEILSYAGIHTDHIAIRSASYENDIDVRREAIEIHGLDYLYKRVESDDKLLIVDDVYDTGSTIDAVIEDIAVQARLNAPSEVRVAVPYYKPEKNRTDRVPDFFIHETNAWIKFPHSLEGLSEDEIRSHRPNLHRILNETPGP
ncbi:MAG: phosphoribosyltransferase family protein [Pseudomonadota bacterium]